MSAACIEDARRLLLLADDWDDEGAPAFSAAIFARMEETYTALVAYATAHGTVPPEPRIGAVRDGSLDIVWQVDEWMVLVNVSPELPDPVGVYWDPVPFALPPWVVNRRAQRGPAMTDRGAQIREQRAAAHDALLALKRLSMAIEGDWDSTIMRDLRRAMQLNLTAGRALEALEQTRKDQP